VLAVLIGTALVAAYPVRAQNDPPRRADTGGEEAKRSTPPQDTKGNQARSGSRPLTAVELAGDLDIADGSSLVSEVLLARLHDPADEPLGATLQPVGDVLRAQLDLPAGQGLLVASLRDDGPSAQAGLKQNDILLSLADKPLAAADDLPKQLRAAGEAAVPLKVLRAGKPVTLQVRPVYRVTLGPAGERKTEYYFGVSIEPADEALRAQLALPTGQGVVVTEVVAGSPAEKAGVKKYDLVLALADKPIDKPETLAQQVQVARDKPTTLRILRAGKTIILPITGAVREVASEPSQEAFRLLLVGQNRLGYEDTYRNYARRTLAARAVTEDLRQRLDHVDKELQALRRIETVEKELRDLRAAVEKLHQTLKDRGAQKRD
jgi:membrane-associated protease RseP (regulator of RpoE activity)